MPLLQGTSENLGGDRSVPVECIIHLGDRLSNPRSASTCGCPAPIPRPKRWSPTPLDPETVDTQFLYLLLFNSFMSESSSQANANIGSSVSAATGLEFVSNMVSNWLSSSDYNVVDPLPAQVGADERRSGFRLSKSLINNRLFVEVEGNYLIDNKQAAVNNNSMSNFMGEAHITYLIDRAGTLKLKAFTQTIDRFDENQGFAGDRHRRLLQGGLQQPAGPAGPHPGAFHQQETQGPAHGAPHDPCGRKSGRRGGK
ncbi:MAG: translocation/assembly module TamB domain-containing protein [Alistipes communis]